MTIEYKQSGSGKDTITASVALCSIYQVNHWLQSLFQVDVLVPDIREDDVNMTSIPLQAEGNTLQATNDDEVTSPVSGHTLT